MMHHAKGTLNWLKFSNEFNTLYKKFLIFLTKTLSEKISCVCVMNALIRFWKMKNLQSVLLVCLVLFIFCLLFAW